MQIFRSLRQMQNNLVWLFLFLSKLSFSQINNLDCESSFTLTSIESNSSYTYHANEFIIVKDNYSLSATNSEIHMKAGKVIVLQTDTYIEKGSLYLGRIEECELVLCENLPISKGISPDNNNLNDYLDLSNHCDILNLEIFNRYGLSIYEKEMYIDEWNGRDSKGNLLPVGVYYYCITYESGRQKTGWIYLNY